MRWPAACCGPTLRLADQPGRGVGESSRVVGVVHQRREDHAEIQLGLGAEPGGDAAGEALHVGFHHLHRLALHGAHGAGQRRGLRDHVVGVAGLDAGDAEHRGVRGGTLRATIDCSAVPRWQATSTGSIALLRPRAVRALAGDGDVEERAAGHRRGRGVMAYLPDRHAGPVVHAEDRIAGEPLEQPVLQHGERAADAFLAGLEDEIHRAVEVARLRQVARGAQQHGGVAVVAAGVHAAGVAAAVRQVGLPPRSAARPCRRAGRSRRRRCRCAARRPRRSCRRRDAPRCPIPPASSPRGRRCDAPPARVRDGRGCRGGIAVSSSW